MKKWWLYLAFSLILYVCLLGFLGREMKEKEKKETEKIKLVAIAPLPETELRKNTEEPKSNMEIESKPKPAEPKREVTTRRPALAAAVPGEARGSKTQFANRGSRDSSGGILSSDGPGLGSVAGEKDGEIPFFCSAPDPLTFKTALRGIGIELFVVAEGNGDKKKGRFIGYVKNSGGDEFDFTASKNLPAEDGYVRMFGEEEVTWINPGLLSRVSALSGVSVENLKLYGVIPRGKSQEIQRDLSLSVAAAGGPARVTAVECDYLPHPPFIKIKGAVRKGGI